MTGEKHTTGLHCLTVKPWPLLSSELFCPAIQLHFSFYLLSDTNQFIPYFIFLNIQHLLFSPHSQMSALCFISLLIETKDKTATNFHTPLCLFAYIVLSAEMEELFALHSGIDISAAALAPSFLNHLRTPFP